MEARVLLVCNDENCRKGLMHLFKGSGLSIHGVLGDADLLLEILDREYDLVIYDLESSNKDGLKLIKIMRRIRPKVPLLVISSDPSKKLGGKVLQEGVTYYSVKPIEPAGFKEAVLTILK
ncbi:MAG: response regulator [bacterium]